MTSSLGEQIVRWTARAAVACYVARLATDIALPPGNRRRHMVRAAWTAGAAIYLLHVASAFHFVHHWSHAAAVEHIARQSAAVVGLAWGGGLYINYAFTLVWVFDATRMWLRADPERPAWWFWTVHAAFAFMMLNATVVFGPPIWRWIGAMVIIALGLLAWKRFQHRQSRQMSAKSASGDERRKW